jgi:NAD(P)-dependent dehydrogenase (short-subunit alcohol dehydrogenase family)
MAGRLEAKIALISGTGGGQGRAAVLRFVAEGAKVVCCDVNGAGNDETVELGRAAGGDVVGIAPLDIAEPAGAARWIGEAIAKHGRIDILYNNASATRFTPVGEIPDDEWRFVMKNEIDVAFYPTRAAWPHLKESRGVIVNIASVAGMVGSQESAGLAHATAKGAIIAMTRQLAVEGGPFGIRAVSISPGAIVTPGTADIMNNPQVKAALMGNILVNRLGLPEDIVSAAVFVASDEAGYITGVNFAVDGGHTAF